MGARTLSKGYTEHKIDQMGIAAGVLLPYLFYSSACLIRVSFY